nr:BV-like protein [Cotesia vestalis bracovirus]
MDRVADKLSEIKKIVRKKIDGVTVKKESISKSTERTDGKQKLEDSGFKDSAQASTSSTRRLNSFYVRKSSNPKIQEMKRKVQARRRQ